MKELEKAISITMNHGWESADKKRLTSVPKDVFQVEFNSISTLKPGEYRRYKSASECFATVLNVKLVMQRNRQSARL